MNTKDDLVFIEHILESINALEEFSKNLSKEELGKNRLKKNAIVREIEIIGEAVKNISNETKNKHSNVKWKEIVGTRDKMIYHYVRNAHNLERIRISDHPKVLYNKTKGLFDFGVDLEIVWKIIQEDIFKLKEQIQRIKEELI